MTWRLATSLETLRDEVNAAAPNRSKVSDGTVGDLAHSSRPSDHNVNAAGVVRAIDLTDDPDGGLNCNVLADRLTQRLVAGHTALRSGAYVIWSGRIFSYDRRDEGWRIYTGSNPHNHHLHLSVASAAAGYDSTAPWGVMEETVSPDQEDRIVERTAKRVVETLLAAEVGDKDKATVSQVLNRMKTWLGRQ